MTRGAVLVVDDNVELADNLAELLELGGAAVSVAHDAEQALKELTLRSYSVVVTDLRMPGLSGLQLLRQIRDAQPGVSVILVTAYAQDSQLEEARAAGVLQVLPKPLDIQKFIQVCACALAQTLPILILEDDDHARANLMEMLQRLPGAVPYAAANIEQAEQIERAIPIRAAVLDQRLPSGCGRQFGSRLKSRRGETVAVVYVTGFLAELQDADTGAVVLEKPCSPAALLDALAGALECCE